MMFAAFATLLNDSVPKLAPQSPPMPQLEFATRRDSHRAVSVAQALALQFSATYVIAASIEH